VERRLWREDCREKIAATLFSIPILKIKNFIFVFGMTTPQTTPQHSNCKKRKRNELDANGAHSSTHDKKQKHDELDADGAHSSHFLRTVFKVVCDSWEYRKFPDGKWRCRLYEEPETVDPIFHTPRTPENLAWSNGMDNEEMAKWLVKTARSSYYSFEPKWTSEFELDEPFRRHSIADDLWAERDKGRRFDLRLLSCGISTDSVERAERMQRGDECEERQDNVDSDDDDESMTDRENDDWKNHVPVVTFHRYKSPRLPDNHEVVFFTDTPVIDLSLADCEIEPHLHKFDSERDLYWNADSYGGASAAEVMQTVHQLTDIPLRILNTVLRPMLCEFGITFGTLKRAFRDAFLSPMTDTQFEVHTARTGEIERVDEKGRLLCLVRTFKASGSIECLTGMCVLLQADTLPPTGINDLKLVQGKDCVHVDYYTTD